MFLMTSSIRRAPGRIRRSSSKFRQDHACLIVTSEQSIDAHFLHVQSDLAGLFEENFSKYADKVPADVIAESPHKPA